MDRKPHPFSTLSESDLEAIISRAHRQRAAAIASAAVWVWRGLQWAIATASSGFRLRKCAWANASPRRKSARDLGQ